MNTIQNQTETFIHLTLNQDAAYIWSVENNSPENMQMVLRAYGQSFDCESAEKQLEVAKYLEEA